MYPLIIFLFALFRGVFGAPASTETTTPTDTQIPLVTLPTLTAIYRINMYGIPIYVDANCTASQVDWVKKAIEQATTPIQSLNQWSPGDRKYETIIKKYIGPEERFNDMKSMMAGSYPFWMASPWATTFLMCNFKDVPWSWILIHHWGRN